MYEAYWDGERDVDVLADVQAVLEQVGVDTEDFGAYCEGQGLEELAAQREAAVAAGGFSAPSCL